MSFHHISWFSLKLFIVHAKRFMLYYPRCTLIVITARRTSAVCFLNLFEKKSSKGETVVPGAFKLKISGKRCDLEIKLELHDANFFAECTVFDVC